MNFALSLSGGGLRGLLQSMVLSELENQTGKKCREIFGWVSGTSVGALLASLIEGGVPMSEALQFFTGPVAAKIFHPQGAVAKLKRLEGFMYESQALADALRNALGPAASWTMNDCPTSVMIPAVDMDGKTWFFTGDRSGNSSNVGSTKLVDAAVGSASAPTYFCSWGAIVNGKPIHLFDGGSSGFGNPAHMLAKEMFRYNDGDPSVWRMISLGTGFYKSPNPAKPPVGLIDTITWLTSTMLNEANDEQDDDAQWMFHPHEDHFTKLNWELARDIDMADLSSVPDLIAVGKQAAKSMDWGKLLA